MARIFFQFILGVMLSVLLACANGTDSSEISSNDPSFTGGTIPLSVAERVTVVDAKSQNLGSSSSGDVEALEADFGKLAEYYYIPSGTPFYTDNTDVYVNERSADIFQTINNILCAVRNTGYKEMLNKGLYVALVDMNKCESGSGDEEGPDFWEWVVRSSRADGQSPHIVDTWFTIEGESDMEAYAQLKTVIYEAKSENNPLGIFRIDYALTFSFFGGDPITYTATIRSYRDDTTDEVLVQYAVGGPPGTDIEEENAVLARGKDDKAGGGSVFTSDYIYNSVSGSYEETPIRYDFGFNDTHFRRHDIINGTVSDDSCYFRNSFNEEVWSYGLYDVNGERFDITTGFPIRYVYNGTDHYGWIDYSHFYVYDSSAPLQSGDTIYRDDSSLLAGTPYELLMAKGKLTRHFKIDKILGDFIDMELLYDYFDYGLWQWQYLKLKWDGSTLNKVAIYNSSLGDYVSITPMPLAIANLTSPTINVESKTAGSLEIVFPSCTTYKNVFTYYDCSTPPPDNLTQVIMRQSHTVKPSHAGIISSLKANGLLCFSYCPDANKMLNLLTPTYYADSAGSLMMYQENVDPTDMTPGVLNTVAYSVDDVSMMLSDDRSGGLEVKFGPTSPGTYQSLRDAGPFIINTTANRDGLRCSTDTTSPAYDDTCADKAETLDEYFTWSTGTSSYYQLVVLKDLSTNAYFDLDEPLPISYTHKVSGEYYNQTFVLRYNGFGNGLWDIPYKCIDTDTWTVLDTSTYSCDQQGGRYIDAFTIPLGGKLIYIDVQNNAHEYFAKALDKEQYMLELADTYPCSKISVQSYPLNGVNTIWQDPALGLMPVIDAPPAVVDGELQNENQ